MHLHRSLDHTIVIGLIYLVILRRRKEWKNHLNFSRIANAKKNIFFLFLCIALFDGDNNIIGIAPIPDTIKKVVFLIKIPLTFVDM